ncbi:hypothetical protein [Actinomadura sp. 7K534]|uniref:hypothetical protein n=1 Tax=Actinomadura sp. 7K534 TaxID=2530366 RepID=UPI0010472491|nr:hypothetical protein [Actinomadura sp. 7K534]TDB95621.1 hypothetical protein E1266_12500 [Actinomadura sp. 7K534]
MPESRPEFEPPDQQLDGSQRPTGDPPADPPEPAAVPFAQAGPAAEPRWRRTARRPWPLAAGALAVVALSGAVWASTGDGGESGSATFTSTPEPCTLVPWTALEQHVPNSSPPVPSETGPSATERYAACEWTEPQQGTAGAETLTFHRLNVAVRLHLDGVEQAEAEYDAAWNGARTLGGTSKAAGGSLHAEAPIVIEMGDEAFVGYTTLKGSLGEAGTVTATVRLRNAVITVRYRGTTSRLGKDGSPKAGASKALDEEAARAGAETIAKGVVDALSNCADCLSR